MIAGKWIQWTWITQVTRSKVSLIVCILMVIMNIGFYIGMFLPVAQEQQQLHQTLAELRKEIVQVMSRQALKDVYTEALKNIENFESKLASVRSHADIVKSIETLANSTKVKVLGNNYERSKQGENIEVIRQELLLEGRYDQLKAFTQGIKGLDTVTHIVETQLESTISGKLLKAKLVMETLRRA